MKKRIIISVILIILIFIITKCSLMIKETRIEDNLKANSVYYAKNMPHAKDKRLVISMLINNLEYYKKNKPNNLTYDFDGYNLIINESESKYFSNGHFKDIFFHYTDSYGTSYNFDYNFKLKYSIDKNYNDINISNINEQTIIDEIYELVKPVIDAQTEPEENLQEEFNKRYKDRFN